VQQQLLAIERGKGATILVVWARIFELAPAADSSDDSSLITHHVHPPPHRAAFTFAFHLQKKMRSQRCLMSLGKVCMYVSTSITVDSR
jgi:hypothetical protein